MIELLNKEDKTINSEMALIKFLNTLLPEDILILIGDIKELKQFKDYKILKTYGLAIGLMFSRKNTVYIVGNHDIKMLGQSIYNATIQPSYVAIVQPFYIRDNILFMHGHQFDWLNNKHHWIVDWALQALRWIEEQINPHIDVDLDRLLRYGRVSDSDEKYIKLSTEEAVKTGVNTVVLGHTHRKKIVSRSGIYYCNSGCWVNGNRDVLHIRTDNNNIYCISDLHLGDKGKADDFWTI